MKVSGFSFVRNGVVFDYPFLESIHSILPLCHEFVVAVGASDDDTLRRIESLKSPKLKIIETTWDESLRSKGAVLAQQTDIALGHVSGDWAFYLQADEVVHEQDLDAIHQSMQDYLSDRTVEGLLFNYRHFYGSYRYVGVSRRWYRNEIRVIRNGIGVHSWGDAQGFRINSRKLRVKPVNANIYHYGWVKRPREQQRKQQSFHKLWHSDEWVRQNIGESPEFIYNNGGKLQVFVGTHPAVMKERIQKENWRFEYDPGKIRQSLKEYVLDWLEGKTGYRLGEYKNYVLI